MTTQQQTVINKVWDFVENIPSRKGAMAIAGGAIADVFFGKDFTDIDVFVSATEMARVQLFVDYYGFEPVVVPEQFREVEDSYGNLRKIRIGKQESDIVVVYKGKWLDYGMDIVVVRDEDIAAHVTTKFDQSIKACWFDGEFHYSDAFMETVASGEIFPIRYEASGYARAWLSAKKYDLTLSNMYDLSKHWVAYASKHDKLDQALSAATISKIENYKEEMFNFKVERSNVILMDVFMGHAPHNEELYYKLTKIANQDVVTRHPLHGTEFSVSFESSELHNFTREISMIRNVAFKTWTGGMKEMEASDALSPVHFLGEDKWMAGKCRDTEGRETRIGKYLMKIQRKYKDIFGQPDVAPLFANALKILENRSVSNKAKVFITGSKHALTHISAKTEWTSCQKWTSFKCHHSNNYGLLANVAGSTLVAYVADERADNMSSKWKARILIRVGVNGIVLENTYSNRVEYYQNDALIKSLQAELKAAGYNAMMTDEEAMDFQGYPMWARPYNDTSSLKTVTVNGMHIFRGRREEIEKVRRIKAIQGQLCELLQKEDYHFMKIGKYERVHVMPIPTELNGEVDWLLYSHNRHLVVSNLPIHKFYNHTTVRIELIEDEYVIVIKQEVPSYLRRENRVSRPTFGQVYAAPMPMMAVAARGADFDGDDPFAVPVAQAVGFDDLPF